MVPPFFFSRILSRCIECEFAKLTTIASKIEYSHKKFELEINKNQAIKMNKICAKLADDARKQHRKHPLFNSITCHSMGSFLRLVHPQLFASFRIDSFANWKNIVKVHEKKYFPVSKCKLDIVFVVVVVYSCKIGLKNKISVDFIGKFKHQDMSGRWVCVMQFKVANDK